MGVMKPSHLAFLLTLFVAPLLTGCQVQYRQGASIPSTTASHRSNSSHRVPVAMPVSGEVKGVPTYGIPFRVPGHKTWISSFVITKSRSIFRDSDPFSEGGLAGSGQAAADSIRPHQLRAIDVRWHDAVFTDGRGGKSWSLLDRRGFIAHWWMLVDNSEGRVTTQLSIFSAVIDDTNSDGFLDNKDAAVAILTGGDGRHANMVTPRHMQLAAVRYVPEHKLISFDLREDSNEDGVFASDEPMHFYFLDQSLDTPTAKPWHKNSFQEELESRYL
jgi:hypothetical protein